LLIVTYDISKLLVYITNRHNRSSFERVIGCVLQKEYNTRSLLGNIHQYILIGIKFDEKDNFKHLPIVKVFSGR